MKKKLSIFLAIALLIGVVANHVIPAYATNDEGAVQAVSEALGVVEEAEDTEETAENVPVVEETIEDTGNLEEETDEEPSEPTQDVGEAVVTESFDGAATVLEEQALAFEFSVEAIMAAGVVDENLAEAIYDSVIDQPEAFLDGNTLENNSYTSIEELLNGFNGELDARNKGIKVLDGIRLMKACLSWDLRNNEIEDLTPISGMPKETSRWEDYTEEQKHFYGTYGVDLEVDFRNNPIKYYPRWIEGRLITESMTKNRIEMPSKQIVAEHDGTFSYVKSVSADPGVYVSESRVRLRKADTLLTFKNNTSLMGAELVDYDENVPVENLDVVGIKRSGDFEIWYAPIEIDRMTYPTVNDPDSDYMLEDTETIGWKIPVSVKFYNTVKIDTEDQPEIDPETNLPTGNNKEVENFKTTHSIVLKKTGADDGEGKGGAQYALYAKSNNELIGSYTTDEDGYIKVDGIEEGSYYFQETVAPEGYKVNGTPIEFTVEGEARIDILGGTGQSIATTDGTGGVIQGMDNDASNDGDGTFVLSGTGEDVPVTLSVNAPEGIVLKSITVAWTEGVAEGTDENGKAVLVPAGAGQQTFTGENMKAEAEAKIAECRALYQNATVAATFEGKTEVSQSNELLPVEFELTAKKKLMNVDETADFSDSLEADMFTFLLEATGENTPALPEGYKAEVTNAADGSISFAAISVGSEITAATPKNENGYYEYKYKITEQGGDSRYGLDTIPCEVTVEVGKAEGSDKLEVIKDSISYTKNGVTSNTFVNKYKSFEAKINLAAVKQVIDSKGNTVAVSDMPQFKFKLTPKVGTPALPAGYTDIVENDENGNVTFAEFKVGGEITPSTEREDGIYTYYYTIEETDKTNTSMYDYDNAVYEVEVVVNKNDPENPQITYKKNESTSDAVFKNTFKLPEEREIELKATKVLIDKEGNIITAPEGSFTFTIDTDKDATNGIVGTTSNGAGGVVSFDAITIGDDLTYDIITNDEDGKFEYSYYISETNVSLPYYVCDTAVYKVTVSAEIKEGQLVPVKVTYEKDGEAAGSNNVVLENGVYDLGTEEYLKFTNTYNEPSPAEVAIKATKVLKDKDGNPITAPEGSFTFTVDTDKDATNGIVGTTSNGANGVVSFDMITVGEGLTPETIKNDADGVFEYTYYITETEISLPYYECDPTVYEVIVGLSVDDNNQLVPKKVTCKSGETTVGEVTTFTKDEAGVYDLGTEEYLKFTNTYNEPSPAEVQIKATKILKDKDGNPITAPEGSFTFTIDTDKDATNGIVGTTSNGAGGVVSFDAITIGDDLTYDIITNDEDGKFEYSYYISETNIALPNYVCDTTVYEVIVGLSIDANNQLVPEKVTCKSGETTVGEVKTFTKDEAGVYDLGIEEYLTFTNTYNAPAPIAVELEATKILNDEAGQAINMPAGEFKFKVVSGTASTPMPENVTASNDKNGKVTFPAFSIGGDILPTTKTNANGCYEYKYVIVEVDEKSKDYTYDPAECEVTVELKLENGQLSISSLSYENDAAVFTNTYHAPEPVEIQLEATKKLLDKSGKDISNLLTKGMFSFEIEAVGETPALPEDYVSVVSNDAEGKVVFNKITVGTEILPTTEKNADGYYEYHYNISETNEGDVDYIYDDVVYMVTVLVEKIDGKLVQKSIMYVKNEEVSEEGAVFVNTKIPKEVYTPPTPVQPESPITGDSSAVLLWAAAALVSFAAILLIFKKAKR